MEQQEENKKKGKKKLIAIGLCLVAVGAALYKGAKQQQQIDVLSKELSRELDDELYLLGQIQTYEKEIKRLGRENANLNYQLGKLVSEKLKS